MLESKTNGARLRSQSIWYLNCKHYSLPIEVQTSSNRLSPQSDLDNSRPIHNTGYTCSINISPYYCLSQHYYLLLPSLPRGRSVILRLKLGTIHLLICDFPIPSAPLNAVLKYTYSNSFHTSLPPSSPLTACAIRLSLALTLCALQIFVLFIN